MKTLIAMLCAGALASASRAGEAEQRTGGPLVLRAKPVATTGSRIAHPVRRLGHTYDTAQSIYVLDRAHIERSGARDVGDLLRRVPFAGVR